MTMTYQQYVVFENVTLTEFIHFINYSLLKLTFFADGLLKLISVPAAVYEQSKSTVTKLSL